MAPLATTTLERYENQSLAQHTKLDSIQTIGSGTSSENSTRLSKELVARALNDHINKVDADTCEAGAEDTFFVADVGEVYRQHLRWKRNLGRVKPHYGTSRQACDYLNNADLV